MTDTFRSLKVISRKSSLALKQVEEVFSQFPALKYELIVLESYGDKPNEISLLKNPPPDVSTRELNQAILQSSADIAIYPANNLSYPLAAGLDVVALVSANATDDSLAIVARSGRPDLQTLFAAKDVRVHYGKVLLVGFGPGNLDLLTLGGDKALSEADIIFHDDLLDKNFLKKYWGEKVYVGKRKGRHSIEQSEINQLLLEAARAGKQVVRLKGGDPMLFAHGGEEIEFLQSNFVEVEVIPGVSSGLAVAALTKIPLTHRDIASSVAFISGHTNSFQIPDTDTLVYFMGGSTIQQIARKAIEKGKNPLTPVMLTYNVSMPDQQEFYSTLQELSESEHKFPTPIIIVIGDVVALRNRNSADLGQPQVLVTGMDTSPYEHLGRIVHQPLIRIEKIEKNWHFHSLLATIDRFDWIFFTSRNAVEIFFETLMEQGKDSRALSQVKIASIGHITSDALLRYGIKADLQAYDESSEGLLRQIKEERIPSAKALVPRSDVAPTTFLEGLDAIGWNVTPVIIYRTLFPSGLKQKDMNRIHTIVFSSPSCVTNFFRLYGLMPENKKLIFKGKETEKRFHELAKTFKSNVKIDPDQ